MKCYCYCSAYLSSCHRTSSDANLLDDPHTFHYNNYFVIRGIRTCLGVSNDPMFLCFFFEFLSTEFAACSKLLSRDNHRKASYPRTQQRDQGGGWTQTIRSESSKNDAFTHSATLPRVFSFSVKMIFVGADSYKTQLVYHKPNSPGKVAPWAHIGGTVAYSGTERSRKCLEEIYRFKSLF